MCDVSVCQVQCKYDADFQGVGVLTYSLLPTDSMHIAAAETKVRCDAEEEAKKEEEAELAQIAGEASAALRAKRNKHAAEQAAVRAGTLTQSQAMALRRKGALRKPDPTIQEAPLGTGSASRCCHLCVSVARDCLLNFLFCLCALQKFSYAQRQPPLVFRFFSLSYIYMSPSDIHRSGSAVGEADAEDDVDGVKAASPVEEQVILFIYV